MLSSIVRKPDKCPWLQEDLTEMGRKDKDPTDNKDKKNNTIAVLGSWDLDNFHFFCTVFWYSAIFSVIYFTFVIKCINITVFLTEISTNSGSMRKFSYH